MESLHHDHDRAVSSWFCFNHPYQKGKKTKTKKSFFEKEQHSFQKE